MLQQLVVGLIVLGAAAYAAWALMPAAWRRGLATRLGRPVPPAGGCSGCGGCDAAPPPGTPQPVKIVRRRQ